ncbi:MAG TPA: Xaa-Pro peptidase family protein [Gaiellaceae bacterium]|nr:Xaa-Pro peptidase family protein [Gaiellaceae bacterium]
MPDVLIYGDTIRSPELRHEVPVSIPDPFVYVERNGTRTAYVGSLEVPRLREVESLETVPLEELGLDELVAQGLSWHELTPELVLRACRAAHVEAAVTPRDFPLELADFLRAHEIQVTARGELFDERRRVKSEAELAGIGRSQRAAERAMDAIRTRLRAGPPVTCEELQAGAMGVFSREGVLVDDVVLVSAGAQTTVGHEPGSGPIREGEPVVVDLFPRDPASGCYADMTRTFCLGEPPEELVRYHALVREALDLAYATIRPGVTGAEAHRAVCDLFEKHGYRTQLSKEPGEVLEEGFFHSLGHGVGLEVHELPGLGRVGEEIVAGDVLAIEPGLYRTGFGGCRLEDLVLVTEDGCEVLTDFPYELAP